MNSRVIFITAREISDAHSANGLGCRSRKGSDEHDLDYRMIVIVFGVGYAISRKE